MIDSTMQVDSFTTYLFMVSSKCTRMISNLKTRKKKMVKEKDTPKPKVEGN